MIHWWSILVLLFQFSAGVHAGVAPCIRNPWRLSATVQHGISRLPNVGKRRLLKMRSVVTEAYISRTETINRLVSQVRASLAACRALAGGYNRLPMVLYVFQHKPIPYEIYLEFKSREMSFAHCSFPCHHIVIKFDTEHASATAVLWTNTIRQLEWKLSADEISQDLSLRWVSGEYSSQWRHNERNCVLNHQPHDCLLNRLFRRRSKITSKLRVTGLCEGNSPVTGEFPTQRASNVEDVSIWWRHLAILYPPTKRLLRVT